MTFERSEDREMASLDKTCPKCGCTITPDQVKRVDFERVECPKCGERFRPEKSCLESESGH